MIVLNSVNEKRGVCVCCYYYNMWVQLTKAHVWLEVVVCAEAAADWRGEPDQDPEDPLHHGVDHDLPTQNTEVKNSLYRIQRLKDSPAPACTQTDTQSPRHIIAVRAVRPFICIL